VPAWCAQCNVGPVRTQIMVTLSIVQKWAVGTECINWSMPFVSTGILYRGIILGEMGIMNARI